MSVKGIPSKFRSENRKKEKDPFRGLGSTRRKRQNETDLKNELDRFFKTQSPDIIYMSNKKRSP